MGLFDFVRERPKLASFFIFILGVIVGILIPFGIGIIALIIITFGIIVISLIAGNTAIDITEKYVKHEEKKMKREEDELRKKMTNMEKDEQLMFQ